MSCTPGPKLHNYRSPQIQSESELESFLLPLSGKEFTD